MHRIEHNLALRKSWFEARKLRIGIPPITEQLPTLIVNKRALFPYGYNPSIIRHDGRVLMAYRYHRDGSAASSLAVAELSGDCTKVLSNTPIDLVSGSFEDPRLFGYGGAIGMSYVVSDVPKLPTTSVVRWGILREGKPWKVEGQWLPNYGKNDGTAMEKNWVFYEEEGQLKAIYQSSPEVEIIEVQENITKRSIRPRVSDVHEGDMVNNSIRWKYGGFKGGTTPFKMSDGRTMRFFHSRLDNEPRPIQWRYYVGAMILDESGNITAVSKKPILRGSEYDDLATTEAASCVHHKKNVVFPAGAIAVAGGWMLSVGINDSSCGLVKVEEKDLNL